LVFVGSNPKSYASPCNRFIADSIACHGMVSFIADSMPPQLAVDKLLQLTKDLMHLSCVFVHRIILVKWLTFVWDAGRDSPDMWTSGDSYRYGHEYRLLQGNL
jgi:hypothetical protein